MIRRTVTETMDRIVELSFLGGCLGVVVVWVAIVVTAIHFIVKFW